MFKIEYNLLKIVLHVLKISLVIFIFTRCLFYKYAVVNVLAIELKFVFHLIAGKVYYFENSKSTPFFKNF